ncbi:DUF3090 domain-containing protein [Kineococcus aurantiacus]|uniref:Putative repeat protein (TIGR03847 family) n=1 Tax=Kineococcus aurantiacus TaxID=37633 RepID=A0A7Y9ASH5_9ACTN|nr:DUF3090 domain-containing protein [Kineococcus aurantiacus]NYD20664.1 putative repeat protein (TIGR03847 family) [Kineococcus aurantiacus]
MPVFEYDPPERFVAGTVGEPGQRTFFLQARSGTRLTSVALEKTQVTALAERVGELLDEVVRRSGGSAPVPAMPAAGSEDTAPLDLPLEEEFRVGTMSLAWDGERDVVVIECFEVTEEDLDPELPELSPQRNVLRVSLDGTTARAFAARSLALVAAGRPPCPFCAGPLDPSGHVCPRANGYRR